MVAVYFPALVVYKEEISFTTPIFESIILRSFGATILADQVFDLRHVVVGNLDARIPWAPSCSP